MTSEVDDCFRADDAVAEIPEQLQTYTSNASHRYKQVNNVTDPDENGAHCKGLNTCALYKLVLGVLRNCPDFPLELQNPLNRVRNLALDDA